MADFVFANNLHDHARYNAGHIPDWIGFGNEDVEKF